MTNKKKCFSVSTSPTFFSLGHGGETLNILFLVFLLSIMLTYTASVSEYAALSKQFCRQHILPHQIQL